VPVFEQKPCNLLLLVGLCVGCLLPVLFFAPAALSATAIPAPKGFVNDFASALSPSVEDALNRRLADFNHTTGIEVAIVIVTRTPQNYKRPRDYAQDFFDTWKVGKKGTDNGILIFLDIGDRRVEIITGYGMEAVLPDQLCGRLLRKYALDAFHSNDWAGGLQALLPPLLAIAQKGEPYTPTLSQRVHDFFSSLFDTRKRNVLLILVLYLVFAYFYAWWKVPRCERCGRKMKRDYHYKSAEFLRYYCPFCNTETLVPRPGRSRGGFSGPFWYGGGFGGGGFGGGGSSFGGFGGGSSGGGGAGASF